MADNETIADIIAEMRRIRVREFQDYADRLEAAHKRERGDAAKLREALEEVEQNIHDEAEWANDMTSFKAISLSVIHAALAAPPRNCDKYATADEALKAQEQMFNDSNFANGECKLGCPECDNPRVGCKIAWLFAPATEQEGGAK